MQNICATLMNLQSGVFYKNASAGYCLDRQILSLLTEFFKTKESSKNFMVAREPLYTFLSKKVYKGFCLASSFYYRVIPECSPHGHAGISTIIDPSFPSVFVGNPLLFILRNRRRCPIKTFGHDELTAEEMLNKNFSA